MNIKGRLRQPVHYVEALSGAEKVSIRIDDAKDSAFWLEINLDEGDLRFLLDKLEEARRDAADDHDEGGCPECERSHGPHYTGPCDH